MLHNLLKVNMQMAIKLEAQAIARITDSKNVKNDNIYAFLILHY